jgi:PAS domain S-box-containing protein
MSTTGGTAIERLAPVNPRKRRANDDVGAARYNTTREGSKGTGHMLSEPHAVQRTRIVADQLYDWCAQRDDSGQTQLIEDTVRSQAYALCEMDARSGANHIVLCSEAFCCVTGYPRKEAVGRPISMIHGAKTSQESATRVESAMLQGEAATMQMTSYTRAGTPFWNMVHVVPVPVETAARRRLSFVLLTNVSEHLLCGWVGQSPIGLGFLSEHSTDTDFTRSLLGASLVCRAEHEAMLPLFENCGVTAGMSFCVANPALDNCPISFVSTGFLDQSGCSAESVLGQSCCVAGGLPTDEETLEALLRENAKGLPLATRMMAWPYDCGPLGGPVLQDVLLAPLFDEHGAVARIVVMQPSDAETTSTVGTSDQPIHHVVRQLTDAGTVEGSCIQFFFQLRNQRQLSRGR